jgi:heme/copper-type cytochrome/quinol oxidase subunit 3
LESSSNIADEMSLENQNHEEARTNPATLIFLFSRVAIFVTLITGSYPAGYKRIINAR